MTAKNKENSFIITLDFFFFEHYILGPEGASKWEMFVTLQHGPCL